MDVSQYLHEGKGPTITYSFVYIWGGVGLSQNPHRMTNRYFLLLRHFEAFNQNKKICYFMELKEFVKFFLRLPLLFNSQFTPNG